MEMTPQGGAPAPGWYADPNDPGSQRYWDGSNWTENRTPAAANQGGDTNGKAIAALVLGIVWACGVGSILALVFGYGAKNEIDQSGGLQQGRGMAVAGIVLGWIGVGILILYLVLWIFFGALSFGLSGA